MGHINSDVYDQHLKSHADEERLIRPFLNGFHVNWARRRRAYNADLSIYFLGPENFMSDLFGFDREIMLVISNFSDLQARTMQAIEQFINDDPAKGRVDPTLVFILTRADQAKEWVSNYVSFSTESRIPIVFSIDEIISESNDAWLIRNIISTQLFTRDLFSDQLPIDSDTFFFGRDTIVADHTDALRRCQNRGLFGLRKTGKTSVLLKVKRNVERNQLGHALYYDAKIPAIRNKTWEEFLDLVTADIAKVYGITRPPKRGSAAEKFQKTVRALPGDSNLVLMFDEIEYISPKSVLDKQWHDGFVPFWQTLWSVQSQHRRICYTVAGVNPHIVEVDRFSGVQNPMFGIFQPEYLKGFSFEEMKAMVRFFGRRMGLAFNDSAIAYLFKRYGGHPLLTRMACGVINRHIRNTKLQRPFAINEVYLKASEADRESELIFYSRHVISEIKEFYPEEYSMLELLAARQSVDFLELSGEPEWTRHLREYGLIQIDNAGRAEFAIPVVKTLIARELARREGRPTTLFVVPMEKRDIWISSRCQAIVNNFRQLINLSINKMLPKITDSSSVIEFDRVVQISPATDRISLEASLTVLYRNFIEAIDTYGKALGKPKYFFEEIKLTYPELWKSLYRIRIYRHHLQHTNLIPAVKEALKSFQDEDFDGKEIGSFKDSYFICQQAVLDEFLFGILIEINRFS